MLNQYHGEESTCLGYLNAGIVSSLWLKEGDQRVTLLPSVGKCVDLDLLDDLPLSRAEEDFCRQQTISKKEQAPSSFAMQGAGSRAHRAPLA